MRDYSAYDLHGSMRTSGVRYAWPSTRTRIYDEPKNLVAHGLATVRTEATGDRERRMYSITETGREVLATWLEEPGTSSRSENEALLKVFLASHGSRQALETQLDAIQAALEQDYESLIATLNGLGNKPDSSVYFQRAHLSDLLIADALGRLEQTTDWLKRARARVAEWDDTATDAQKRQIADDSLHELVTTAQANLRAIRRG